MLTPRVFVTQTVDKEPYNIDFVPVMIDGSEYYELKSKDFHYGYMTEALANKIFETRPGSKERYVDSFSFETKVKDNQQYLKLKNRIILDLPSKIDEANAFSAFSFYGIKYAEDPKKEPIFIKSKIGYSLSGVSSEIEFIFPDNKLNCGGFNVHDVNKGLTTIEIDAPNGNIKSININRFTFPGNEEKDTHLSVTFEKEWGELLINNSYIPTYPGESGYLRIKTGDQLSLVNGGINSDNQKDYYMIGSATNGVDLGNSEITFFDGGNDKCSYLKAKGLLHAYSSKLSIGGTNIVNGDLTYSENERKKALLILRNLTSYSNLNIKSSVDGVFNFIDTTISNGKKIITIDERCNLINSSIENEGKKDLELFSPKIRHSRLKNISSLGRVIISNSDIENLNLKCNNYDSSSALIYYGPENYCQYSDYGEDESLEMICSLKNTTIELGHDEFFNIRTENSVNISNSLIKGHTLIGDIIMGHEQYKLSIDNSLLNNLKMTLTKSDLDEIPNLTIKNSELKGVINATGLESVEDSIIASSTLSNISKINGAMIEDKELDYNSYQHESDEPEKEIGQVTNEMEIL